MNIEKTKNKISISKYISALGLKPKKKYGEYELYSSPLHLDRHPSFSINKKKNRWFDYSLNKGGDVIDLVRAINNCSTAQALEILSGVEPELHPDSFKEKKPNEKTKITIKKIKPLRNANLISYANERGISTPLAAKYLQEIWFFTPKKEKINYALAMRNVSGGFALRNKYQKLAISPVDFSFIPGARSEQLNIFEGFFDFLSAFSFLNCRQLKYDSVVLNSTINEQKCRHLYGKYEQLNLFLDNDPAGRQTAEVINRQHHNTKNMSELYFPNNKDFNEFLLSKSKTDLTLP